MLLPGGLSVCQSGWPFICLPRPQATQQISQLQLLCCAGLYVKTDYMNRRQPPLSSQAKLTSLFITVKRILSGTMTSRVGWFPCHPDQTSDRFKWPSQLQWFYVHDLVFLFTSSCIPREKFPTISFCWAPDRSLRLMIAIEAKIGERNNVTTDLDFYFWPYPKRCYVFSFRYGGFERPNCC